MMFCTIHTRTSTILNQAIKNRSVFYRAVVSRNLHHAKKNNLVVPPKSNHYNSVIATNRSIIKQNVPATTTQVAWKSTLRVDPDDDNDYDHHHDNTENIRGGYNVSKTFRGSTACKDAGIDTLGITGPTTIYRNLNYQELYNHEVSNKEGKIAKARHGDTFAVDTGAFTGRSPKDKWLVRNIGSESDQNIDWGSVNQPTSPEVFDELFNKAVDYLNTRDDVYVFDGYCGASPVSRKKIRFVHEMAWQQHFVTNMFIRPDTINDDDGNDDEEVDFTVINCCSQVNEDWKRHGLNSDTAIVFNIEKKCAVIFGTWYGGENKKGIFSLMNYWLPMSNVLSMHCSANVGVDENTGEEDTALFFGLSGTGKTTLSAHPNRALIGDDEHGWDEHGVFNMEGGCYAKTINLSEETEPDIYRAIKTDAMLENVALRDDDNNVPDYFDTSKTENGRVSYPIFHIPNYHKPQMASHPNNIIFLSCDAFGVLPPVAKLSTGQAMYHFLSGYTAKVAGTERGITEPTATFSACFGAAFLMLPPTRYADLLFQKIQQQQQQHDNNDDGCNVFLVNTGWSGGPYGVGKRMSIDTSRACIDAILNKSIHEASFRRDDVFGFEVPTELQGLKDPSVLDPKSTWSDPDAFDETAKKLANMYIQNFETYKTGGNTTDYSEFGPKV